MLKQFNPKSLRTPVLGAFGIILLMNLGYGAYSYYAMIKLRGSVETVYDKILMSSTFSQSALHNFLRFAKEVENCLFSQNLAELKQHFSQSDDFFEAFQGDLKVVSERSVSAEDRDKVHSIQEKIQALLKVRNEFVTERQHQIEKSGTSPAVTLKQLRQWAARPDLKILAQELNKVADHAAEIGYTYRLSAAEETLIAVRLAAILAIFTLCLGIFIAFRIIQIILPPLTTLREACDNIASGQQGTRIQGNLNYEYGILKGAFNIMLDIIEVKEANLRALLGSLQDGVFSLNNKGEISEERSKATDKIFPMYSAHKTFSELLAHSQYSGAQQVNLVLKCVWDTTLSIATSSVLDLLPSRILLNGPDGFKAVSFGYRVVKNSQNIPEKVIVIATDITAVLEAEELRVTQEEKAKRITLIVRNREPYREFIATSTSLFENSIQMSSQLSTNNRDRLNRDLHTLKGLLGTFTFIKCMKQIHEVENQALTGTGKDLGPSIKAAQADFFAEVNEMTELLNLDAEKNYVRIHLGKFQGLSKFVSKTSNSALQTLVTEMTRYPVQELFQKYPAYVSEIVSSQGKEVEVIFDSESSEITPDEASLADAILIHLVRNSADHGIEPSAVREANGKPKAGKIVISTQRLSGKGIILRVKDDGKGLDADRLAAKAVEVGFWTEDKKKSATRDEIYALIFEAGFSTANSVTETSGRGMGMDSIKNTIEKMGGSISFDTHPGKGTEFKIVLPSPEEI